MTSSPVFHSAGALFGQSLSTRANDLRLKKVNALALSISNMVSEKWLVSKLIPEKTKIRILKNFSIPHFQKYPLREIRLNNSKNIHFFSKYPLFSQKIHFFPKSTFYPKLSFLNSRKKAFASK